MIEFVAIPIGRRPRCDSDDCDRPATFAAIRPPAPAWPRHLQYRSVWFLCGPHLGGHKRSPVLRKHASEYVRLEVIATAEVVTA